MVNFYKSIILLLCVISVSCSAIFVENPPPEPLWNSTEPYHHGCTDSLVAPVIDTVFTASCGYGVAMGVTGNIVCFLAWGASAIYGYDAVSDCKQYKAAYITQRSRQNFSPSNDYDDLRSYPRESEDDDSEVSQADLEKAKLCQKKGGFWVKNSCQIDLSSPSPASEKSREETILKARKACQSKERNKKDPLCQILIGE
jgi:hypothetical protein